MDGVLVDSVSFHMGIWEQILKSYGLVLDEALVAEINGMGREETARYFVEKFGLPVNPSLIVRRKHELEMARIPEGMPLFADASNTLNNLKRLGYRISLGTSGTRDYMEMSIGTSLGDFEFDSIVTASDVMRAKPAPDIFMKCAELIGVGYDECLVVEDSHSGIMAAKAGGMKSVGITTTSKAEVLKDADAIISRLAELNQEMILRLDGRCSKEGGDDSN